MLWKAYVRANCSRGAVAREQSAERPGVGLNRTFAAGLVLIAVAVLILVGWVSWVASDRGADSYTGTAVIDPGSFLDIPFEVRGAFTEIYYEFTAESGPAVDVYLLAGQRYRDYLDGRPVFQSAEAFVHEGVRTVTGSPYPLEGSWHAVIDNTDYGVVRPEGDQARVRYLIEAGGLPTSSLVIFLMCGSWFVILGFGLMFAYLGLRQGPRLPRPAYCPSCGGRADAWLCPRCGLAIPPPLPER